MSESLPDDLAGTPRQLRLRQSLGWLSWLLVSGALAWFIARERLPGWFAGQERGIPMLLGFTGALGGAMLVGAKLALSKTGHRPSLRDMILLILAPGIILFFGSMAVNRYGGEPPQSFLGPVAEVAVKHPGRTHTDLQVKTLSPEGKTLWHTVLYDATMSQIEAIVGPEGYRRGGCVVYRYKTGSMGMRADLDSRPVDCPSTKGEHAAEGPVMVKLPDPDKPEGWQWAYQMADPGPGYHQWQDALTALAWQHLSSVDDKPLTFRVKLEKDGHISAAVLTTAGVMPSVGEALSGTLVGQKNVVALPKPLRWREPIWVEMPGSTSVSSAPPPNPQGNSSEESP